MSWGVVSCAKTQGRAFHLEELAKARLEKQLTQGPCIRGVVNLGIVIWREQLQMRLPRRVGPALEHVPETWKVFNEFAAKTMLET